MNANASAKFNLLTTEELLKVIDPIKEKNFLRVVQELEISGSILVGLDLDMIPAFFRTGASRFEYFNFIKRINKAFEVVDVSEARADIDSIASTPNCQENNDESLSDVLEMPNNSTPNKHKSIASPKKVDWPFNYIYPKERLSAALQEKLSDPDKQLCFSDHGELIKVAFESLLSYKM